jgi:hypothetical protein
MFDFPWSLESVKIRNSRAHHPSVLDADPFRVQTPGLLAVFARGVRKHDTPTRTDNPMPRQLHRLGRYA